MTPANATHPPRASVPCEILKQDPSRSPSNYTAPLPFSSQVRAVLRTFVDRNL